jgi:Na+(H+)/acetate symporter ActP
MNTFLAFIGTSVTEMFAVALVLIVSAVVPVLVVFWFARKLLENGRENTKLRLEVGKLADELEQVRKQQQSN